MSSRALTLLGYGILFGAGILLDVLARTGRVGLRSLDTVLRWALHTRSGRIGIFSAWAWAGVHFLG